MNNESIKSKHSKSPKCDPEPIKIIAPKFIRDIEKRCVNTITIEDEGVFNDITLMDYKIEKQMAHLLNFDGVIFNNVDFRGVVFSSLELSNVRFENCDFSNANFSGAIIHKTEFINCKLMGLNLRDGTLFNVAMKHCIGQFILMGFVQMKNVILTECRFENGNFQDSKFNKVVFTKCKLKQSQMSGTQLSGIDFSDSDIESLGVRIEDIRGAIVSPGQAVDLSKLFGLVIKA